MSPSRRLRLGGVLDAQTLERSGEDVALRPDGLTTHGVIVGMTGSGKTGLGVVLLEEILRSGRPAIVLDPKGDLTNLCLQFPDLAPNDFRPWIDESEARRKGASADDLARETADRWRAGLGSWDLDGDDVRALKSAADLRVYTPGSSAGVGLDLVGRMNAPSNVDPEGRAEAAEALVSGLLALAGLESDPLTSPEHILLTSILEHGWEQGRDLSIESLIGDLQSPPFRKLGVFEVDTFVPPASRTRLALRLNGLVASPTFATWRTGDPLDISRMLVTPQGRPRASIIQLAHLSDSERIFVVTLLLSRLVTWMRGQPGTSDLKALLYIDELFGFAPPTAEPPSKKPLLTLFKQARAHGLGVVVSTQNPVDMDYKLMSNAGTWMIGRLQTERDKRRIIETLKAADGSVDTSAWDRRIGELGKRQFVLKRSKATAPTLFTTRWAMSYLRGPITLPELSKLPEECITGASLKTPAPSDDPAAEPRDGTASSSARKDESPVPPEIADGVSVRFLDPASPWATAIGAAPGSPRLRAGLGFRVLMLFDEAAADLRHVEEWEAVLFPLDSTTDPSQALAVDLDERDFREGAPPEARFVLEGVDLNRSAYFKGLRSDLVNHLYVQRTLSLPSNPLLKLVARPGESLEAFTKRCMDAAEDRADAEASKLTDRYRSKIQTQRDQVTRAERRVQELEVDLASRRQQEMVTGAGELLGMFLGGKRRTRSLSGMTRRRSTTRRTEERLRTAEARLADEAEDVTDLEAELARDLQEIWDRWEQAATRRETREISLEESDIRIAETTLFWAPVPEPD
jgi:hypothetical protein